MKSIWRKLKTFVIQHYILVTVTVVPLGAILFLGSLITYNQTRHFCYRCHTNRGPYHYLNKSRAVHKDVDTHFFGCISCHKDKSVQHIYLKAIKNIVQKAQLAGNLRFKNITNPHDVYTSDECMNCHTDRLKITEKSPYLISSPGLQKLGLRFDKLTHHRFEKFGAADQEKYNILKKKNQLTNSEKKEFALLNKIRIGNCAQCHVQHKQTETEDFVDKQVNFIARNPISCAGCHENVTPSIHPGQPLKMPTRQTCRKCHHGKIHGKFMIFKADCDDQKDTEYCIKCHPLYRGKGGTVAD